jgi:hypothetical protein
MSPIGKVAASRPCERAAWRVGVLSAAGEQRTDGDRIRGYGRQRGDERRQDIDLVGEDLEIGARDGLNRRSTAAPA